MPADWPDGIAPEDEAPSGHDVPLTNDPAPYLVLDGWRNPLMPDNVSASLSGQIIAAAAEGYPKLFEKLGVKPAAKGGDVTKPGALEGEFDPVTPPRYGEEVVKTLPNGRLFVLKGQGHNVIGAGCMPKLFARFLETADAKALDGKCLDTLGYVPPFISFNGWEP